jgi:aryl hydrocarbon receptor nuclear translocator-like protein 1
MFFTANGHNEFQRMINTHIEASKIGSQIAEQVLDHQRRMGESSGDLVMKFDEFLTNF